MSRFAFLSRAHRGKSVLLQLFIVAATGQALALLMGLWLEQKLIDAFATWNVAQQTTSSPSNVAVESTAPTPDPLEVPLSSSDLLTVKIIVFLWICFSQSSIGYLIFSHWNSNQMRQHSEGADAYAKQNHDLIRTRDAVIFGLAKLAESRDPETGQHLERIAIYSTRLASAMRRHPRFAGVITPSFIRTLEVSSALHDIGKVGVVDSILLKPDRLTTEERREIEQHATIGGACLAQIEGRLGNSNFLQMAREIAYSHHERWDGTGYPSNLKGEEIPLAARIISVADVYDALSVRRVYKVAFSHEKCVRIIREGAGTQFDPDIVEVFLQIEAEFRQCAEELSDQFDLGDVGPSVESPVMTPEQEQTFSRIVNSERFCSVDTLMVLADTENEREFGVPSQIRNASQNEEAI